MSWIFGNWIRPNEGKPPWLKEGVAVYAESTLTPRGRGESSTYRMMIRTAVAEGTFDDPLFARLDTIANIDTPNWPWTLP